MSKIDDKHKALKRKGLDLGQPLAPEQDAGFGGRFRRYQNGNIYYHSVMGSEAREVHGGILAAYLAQGGPGPHPQTQQRRFGFPLSDEMDEFGNARVSRFEWGSIYWVPGRAAVPVYGIVHQNLSKIDRFLGLPLSEPVPVAGGEAVYFQRGCLWATSAVANGVLLSTLDVPQLGRPQILDSDNAASRSFPRLATWPNLTNQLYNALTTWRPSVFSEIWRGRLALRPVLAPGVAEVPCRLADVGVRRFSESANAASVAVLLEIQPGTPGQLAHRTLYDLVLNLPNNQTAVISPHCYYAANEWTSFGVLHITDLHVSLRNERYRDQLLGLNRVEAASEYANFQDSLRAFNTYANILHSKGLADVVLATGDLVDYVFEPGQSVASGGNFALLERMLCGGAGTEELRIPIFTVFGNHDYRIHSYELKAEVDAVPGPFDGKIKIDEFPSHNLKPDEAIALQGGKIITVGAGRAVDMLKYDDGNRNGSYDYYLRYINSERNYSVALGPHRIVMVDTGHDVGVPQSADFTDLLSLFWKDLWGSFSESERQAQSGAPNSEGPGGAINLLRAALASAGEQGLVIVGMHSPAFSPPGGEYPFYLRETQHPAADPKQVPALLKRRKALNIVDALEGKLAGWVPNGTPHFKTGPVEKSLDFGIGKGRADEFVRLAAGEGAVRPADVLLCGHQHDRVDFRFRLGADRQLQFFLDFYTENPETYYSTKNNFETAVLPEGHPIFIRVRAGAPVNGQPKIVRDHRGGVTKIIATLDVPPYANPLNSSSNTAQWWQAHRPLLLQSGALGPIDPRQRFDPRWKISLSSPIKFSVVIETATKPDIPGNLEKVEPLAAEIPDSMFRGFRLLQVRNNVIARIRYITLAELRKRGFKLPWENEGRFPRPLPDGPILVPDTPARTAKAAKTTKATPKKATKRAAVKSPRKPPGTFSAGSGR